MYGVCKNSDFWQKIYLEKKLPYARNVLLRFPILNDIFRNFGGYERKNVDEANNFVFRMCTPLLLRDLPRKNVTILTALEKVLKRKNYQSWAPRVRADFATKLTSDDFYVSVSPATELMMANNLIERLGAENIELWPMITEGKKSDLKVAFCGKEIFIEVGNLSRSIPEEKISEILDRTAEELGRRLTDGYFVITVETSEFVWDECGCIDVDRSIRKIVDEADRLKLEGIQRYKGLILFSDISFAVKNEQILIDLGPFASSMKTKLDMIQGPELKPWVNSCRDELSKGTMLFTGIIHHDSPRNVVEVHTKGMFPSKAAIAEQNSFIRHVKTHIDGQLYQLQKRRGNIIVVRGDNWTLFGLYDALEENPLYSEVKKYLLEKNIPILNGVAVVRDDFDNPVFVYNDKCDTSVCCTKEELGQLGFGVII